MSDSDSDTNRDPRATGDPFREVARLVRQRLEVARAFGWSLPLAPWRRVAATPARAAPAPKRQPEARVAVAAPQRSLPPAPAPARGEPRAAREPATDAVDSLRAATAERSGIAERAAREAILEPLRADVRACERCELCRLGRTQTVFGVGDPCARVMFVGEGPGQEEDRRGEPFVGPAGRLLTDIIEKGMGLRREDVYIANVVKCRPPRNRTPTDDEMSSCRLYLERQIETVAPQVIVALGSVAARGLLRTNDSVGRLRGRFHDAAGTPLRVTYHPAYLLRSPHEKRKTWEDIQAVMAFLGLSLPGRG